LRDLLHEYSLKSGCIIN